MSLDSRLGNWNTLRELSSQVIEIYKLIQSLRATGVVVDRPAVLEAKAIQALPVITAPLLSAPPQCPWMFLPVVWLYSFWTRPTSTWSLRQPRKPLELIVADDIIESSDSEYPDAPGEAPPPKEDEVTNNDHVVCRELDPQTTQMLELAADAHGSSVPSIVYCAFTIVLADFLAEKEDEKNPSPTRSPFNSLKKCKLATGKDTEEVFWELVKKYDDTVSGATDRILQGDTSSEEDTLRLFPWGWRKVQLHRSALDELVLPPGICFAAAHMIPKPAVSVDSTGECRFFVHMNANWPYRVAVQTVEVDDRLHINVPVAGIFTSMQNLERLMDVVEAVLGIAVGASVLSPRGKLQRSNTGTAGMATGVAVRMSKPADLQAQTVLLHHKEGLRTRSWREDKANPAGDATDAPAARIVHTLSHELFEIPDNNLSKTSSAASNK